MLPSANTCQRTFKGYFNSGADGNKHTRVTQCRSAGHEATYFTVYGIIQYCRACVAWRGTRMLALGQPAATVYRVPHYWHNRSQFSSENTLPSVNDVKGRLVGLSK